jgi:hypothetical protein
MVTSMRPRNAYKDMLDNVVSRIICVSMNHQNHLEQMANGAMFATRTPLYWCETGERQLFGADIIREAVKQVQIIRENLRIAQSR